MIISSAKGFLSVLFPLPPPHPTPFSRPIREKVLAYGFSRVRRKPRNVTELTRAERPRGDKAWKGAWSLASAGRGGEGGHSQTSAEKEGGHSQTSAEKATINRSAAAGAYPADRNTAGHWRSLAGSFVSLLPFSSESVCLSTGQVTPVRKRKHAEHWHARKDGRSRHRQWSVAPERRPAWLPWPGSGNARSAAVPGRRGRLGPRRGAAPRPRDGAAPQEPGGSASRLRSLQWDD